MISFQYQLKDHTIELQASNWAGWEKVLLDGQLVSRKFNMAANSEHNIQVSNAVGYKLKTMIEPDSQLLICRLYREDNNTSQYVSSLKQGVNHQRNQQRKLYQAISTGVGVVCLVLAANSY
ncbi:hypothetical protein NFHSH190041_23920 [Shewanella sp. NFH-SH190041]|uniref:hypothetical protein n=1 Tax=Shewanella sp. NFH-SH190041 TaxID=2950245 RepID=UPI0021C4978E|nr:hypothetical protein [Shewanella sp. NFH-SH190041]BDM64940.1 hypothetical protein NFHSH190041_23920 [Shewanella sp. NFH-SH190041]